MASGDAKTSYGVFSSASSSTSPNTRPVSFTRTDSEKSIFSGFIMTGLSERRNRLSMGKENNNASGINHSPMSQSALSCALSTPGEGSSMLGHQYPSFVSQQKSKNAVAEATTNMDDYAVILYTEPELRRISRFFTNKLDAAIHEYTQRTVIGSFERKTSR
eukprot:CAMPEP_0117448592 /NCGR_PEP_ID=MMETSP0759-20121206/7486_1 /TAXON_ID=63605 /ORGANISM="Percolomonas cosmopolitus, Strain WS" /LENGTH=160 /DNA_ID=CAMNT_0005240995 /DNA_START=180 /DNA_END=663 /DNA_ORIENTATION=-